MSLENMFSYQIGNAGDYTLWPLLRSHAFVALQPSKYSAAAACMRPQPCAKLAKGVSGLVRPYLN